jgi:thiol-disulfide isomerase/thioredoxin
MDCRRTRQQGCCRDVCGGGLTWIAVSKEGNMLSVSAWTLLAILGAGGETVLLDFTAPWCGPCQSMTPVIRRLESEGFPVRKINIDEHPQLAAQYGVTSVPCFVMLADGREVDREIGAVGHDRLVRMFTAARGAVPAASPEVRGQSPDRVSLAGRLRQAVGGRREEPAPQQAAAPSADIPSYSNSAAEAGPEPPAVLSEFTGGASAAPPPGSAGVPAMAPTFQGVPSPTPATSPVNMTREPQPYPASNAAASPEDRALAASVRLRIDDGQFFSYATGSVIAIRPDGEVLILTCGHVFRDSQGRGAVDVELFGANRQGPLQGQVVAYDLERDLGLVSVRGATGLSPIMLAGNDSYMREGLRAFSIGCDRGAEPSLLESRIVGVNRYLGTPNLVSTGRPVVGRSGGGLFDAEGRLVGVCRGADTQIDEGVYVSYAAIRDQLAAWGLGDFLQTPQANAPAQTLAGAGVPAPPASQASAAIADQPADFDYTQLPPSAAGPLTANATGDTNSRPAVGTTEPVFVVRAGGTGDVLLVERPSPAFLEQLARESAVRLPGAQLPAAVRVAAESAGVGTAGPLVRGQSPYPTAVANQPGGVAVR